MSGEFPTFRFNPSGMSRPDAFEEWRQIMARMFDVKRSGVVDELPLGRASLVLLDDIMANGSFFNGQRLIRDRRRVEASPDHLVLQLYLSGGFVGEMGTEPVRMRRGQVAVCDLRQTLAVEAMRSNTIGVSVPRVLLPAGIERLPPRLDPTRERLLAAHIRALFGRLPYLTAPELPAIKDDLLQVLHCILDPSRGADSLDASSLDQDRLFVADHVISTLLGSPDLGPDLLAERLQVSRATVFRLFEPQGGVMRHVWMLRLAAVRGALDQPSETRTIARLASDHGFKSGAHLTRSFRALFGMTPRDWRLHRKDRGDGDHSVQRLNDTWGTLGGTEPSPRPG